MEREQEFTYYWYAAKQAIEDKDYPRALMLLRFCEQIDATDGKTQEYLGLIYSALHDDAEAERHLEQAYTNNPELWRGYVQILLQQSNGDRKAVKRAIKVVEKVSKREPKEQEVWENLVRLYAAGGKYRKALKAQDKLEKLTGYDAYAAINRYRIYAAWKKPKKAIAEVDRYLEVDPTNMRFWLFKVELLEYTHARWEKLEETYRQILRLDPGNLMILNNYAYRLAISGGDLREAERMSQRTIQAEPNNPIYLDTYAWILHLQGQDQLAAFYIRKALENMPEEQNKEVREHYDAIMRNLSQAAPKTWHTCLVQNARATVSMGEEQMTTNLTMQAVKDSMIVIQVLPMLSIEALRIEATPGQITIIDKLNRRYVSTTYDEIGQYMLPRLTYRDLQSIVKGDKVTKGQNSVSYQYNALGRLLTLSITYPTPVMDEPIRMMSINKERYTGVDLPTLLK